MSGISQLGTSHLVLAQPPPSSSPRKGHSTIRNVESQGSLLFTAPDGQALVDFRRTGGRGDNIFWDIRETRDGKSTFWNAGMGHVIIAHPLPSRVKIKSQKPAEFVVKSVGYPCYVIEDPESHKVWDINYEGEVHYPNYVHLTLSDLPKDVGRISIFWQIQYP
ncbi:hypothetical protein B0H10DRAFT_1943272 [Mycena sp. CBHHK59/15]|nr:hypothetical protein B0H10DRAFT_1943272 [Mycena sp. CBHHK59/15]